MSASQIWQQYDTKQVFFLCWWAISVHSQTITDKQIKYQLQLHTLSVIIWPRERRVCSWGYLTFVPWQCRIPWFFGGENSFPFLFCGQVFGTCLISDPTHPTRISLGLHEETEATEMLQSTEEKWQLLQDAGKTDLKSTWKTQFNCILDHWHSFDQTWSHQILFWCILFCLLHFVRSELINKNYALHCF